MPKNSPSKNLLYLVGPRGAGKTTVGENLADRLGWKFLDADREIQKQQEKTIQEIFSSQGESAFRDLETQFISDCQNLHKTVVSLGGGAVVRPENRHHLLSSGLSIYLRADEETLAGRIGSDPNSHASRPTLSDAPTGSLVQQMIQLNKKRQPFYNEVARWVIDTSGLTVPQIVSDILQRIAADDP